MLKAWMRLFLPISVSVSGVMAGVAQAVQPREVSLSQLAALLSTVGVKTCVYMMTTISLNYYLTKFYRRGRDENFWL